MIIKKGILQQVTQYGETDVMTIVCTVVEKTSGNHTEILFRKDSRVLTSDGAVVIDERQQEFKVYVDYTLSNILNLNEVYGEYTWTTPLTEVS